MKSLERIKAERRRQLLRQKVSETLAKFFLQSEAQAELWKTLFQRMYTLIPDVRFPHFFDEHYRWCEDESTLVESLHKLLTTYPDLVDTEAFVKVLPKKQGQWAYNQMIASLSIEEL